MLRSAICKRSTYIINTSTTITTIITTTTTTTMGGIIRSRGRDSSQCTIWGIRSNKFTRRWNSCWTCDKRRSRRRSDLS